MMQIIPPELQARIAALAAEAEDMLPVIERLSERAWLATRAYDAALDDLFDRDVAGDRTGFHRMVDAILALGGNLCAVYDGCGCGDPDWKRNRGH